MLLYMYPASRQSDYSTSLLFLLNILPDNHFKVGKIISTDNNDTHLVQMDYNFIHLKYIEIAANIHQKYRLYISGIL
jgi:hypothetical protein